MFAAEQPLPCRVAVALLYAHTDCESVLPQVERQSKTHRVHPPSVGECSLAASPSARQILPQSDKKRKRFFDGRGRVQGKKRKAVPSKWKKPLDAGAAFRYNAEYQRDMTSFLLAVSPLKLGESL